MAWSALRYMLVIGFGLIGSGFAEWTGETLLNEGINDLATAFTGHESHKEYINTWNVIQWQFIGGGLIAGVGITLRVFGFI